MRTTTCPVDAEADPLVREALQAHVLVTAFPNHLLRAGGLEDQDALILAALRILSVERAYVQAALAREK